MQRADANRTLMFSCASVSGCLPLAPPVVIGHALALAPFRSLGPIAFWGTSLPCSESLAGCMCWSQAGSTDQGVVDRSVGSSVHASRGFRPSLGRGKSNDSGGKNSAMVDINLLSLARDLRARAQEILARAETIYDMDAEQTMREVAARHEKLAQRVEQEPAAAGM
jgi:hypothetical protein